jgi:hypothetical protein
VTDVPASALVRRRLLPEVARFRYSRSIPLDPVAACQVCGAHERIVVFEPVVDPGNGQRITLALCLLCLEHGVALFNDPPPAPVKPRRRAAEKR